MMHECPRCHDTNLRRGWPQAADAVVCRTCSTTWFDTDDEPADDVDTDDDPTDEEPTP